ncbi:MAG: membrane dipeptidase [Rubellimicrobium sp.]|nr:membrane dipeptidase [Rubellimicrobium sp.]
MGLVIDGLQYANWSPRIFAEMRAGGVDCVHATVAYHETFREMVYRLQEWNRRFADHADMIARATSAEDILAARASGRTAIVLGLQTCTPIEDDLGLIEILHQLGIRLMQLSYNNQSLLATGCYEAEDPGLTRFGREAVAEMNRVGLVIDLSHTAERSSLEAISASRRPVTISHANPAWWHRALRNKSDEVLRALVAKGGMLGLSLYPHHLAAGSDCTLGDFASMAAECVSRYGADHVGIGSDLCQDQPDSVVDWMRRGRWTRGPEFGEGSAAMPGFPPMPAWFGGNLDFGRIRDGLARAGLAAGIVDRVMGDNWLRFYRESFGPG